ncbi:transposase [Sphingobacteriales bacterium UPWRP_1]|nr:transposase [Sphingobacteriales bacterium TSM_CSM]PSJ73743.1 transposase [Sphingobacteriales bacterium UPWRP_1]
MELGQPYFFTATIYKWYHLLTQDKYKDIIVDSLHYLVKHKKITLFAFVIMPNHIHVAWTLLEKNGKELPHASLLKHTAHHFLHDLRQHNPNRLADFEVAGSDRNYQFWQRNSLPIPLFTARVWQQKVDYIHRNPIAEKWQLSTLPHEYKYSSAKFYEFGTDDFNMLTHWRV